MALTWMLAVAAGTGSGLAIPQVPVPPPPPPAPVRDPVLVPARGRGPGEPLLRTVPVGTAAISGVVTAADTGRPIRGARVMVSGSVPAPLRSGGPGATVSAGAAASSAQLTMLRGGLAVSGLMPMTGVSRTAITDAQGRFTISKLPAGRFSVNVNRTGYLNTAYGQRRPGGRGNQVSLADGQQLQLALPMVRGGVITGLIIADDGEPQPNARVQAWRYATESGVKRLQQTNNVSTDDRGMYRLHGLQPGDYVVSATPNSFDLSMERATSETAAIEEAISSGAVRPPAAPGLPATVSFTMSAPQPTDFAPQSYLPTYHPSTAIPGDAAVIHVAGGDEHSGADIQVQFVRSSTIQGTLSTALASGVAVQVSLTNDDPTVPSNMSTTRVQDDGRFVLGNVAPGRYTVFAYTVPAPNRTVVPGNPSTVVQTNGPPRLDDSQKLWARAAVNVDGQSAVSVTLSLQPGRSIAGRVLFDMARPPDLTQVRLTATLNYPSGPQMIPTSTPVPATIAPDGSFVFNGVIPGKYVLRAGGPAVRSSIVNGQDTLDVPLDFAGDRDITDALITVTDKMTDLTVTLTDATGKPAFDYAIVAVSVDSHYWTPGSRRIQVAPQLAADGSYTFRNLPAGDYMLAAVSDLEQGGQYDPEFLRSLAGASMRVTVVEGAKTTQALRVAK